MSLSDTVIAFVTYLAILPTYVLMYVEQKYWPWSCTAEPECHCQHTKWRSQLRSETVSWRRETLQSLDHTRTEPRADLQTSRQSHMRTHANTPYGCRRMLCWTVYTFAIFNVPQNLPEPLPFESRNVIPFTQTSIRKKWDKVADSRVTKIKSSLPLLGYQ